MIGFVFNLGMPELLVILLLLFGGRRLPELVKGLGQGMRALNQATAKSQLEEKGDATTTSQMNMRAMSS
ncbi:MAG: twin-arginine translocase TatA/TatE family subunit [Acidobacteria bacterium]|nr:twin-arginine translocase TatA/TatE family subunit [Acidobacteriota bacterium]